MKLMLVVFICINKFRLKIFVFMTIYKLKFLVSRSSAVGFS